jgi:hypothetical protein
MKEVIRYSEAFKLRLVEDVAKKVLIYSIENASTMLITISR